MPRLRHPLGVVLAGGKSRRMGRDKAFVAFGGKTLVEHVLCRLSRQLPDSVINSAHHESAFGGLVSPLVADEPPFVGLGPLSGLYAALRYGAIIGKPYENIITVAVDTPFFPENYVQRLAHTAASYPARPLIARSGGLAHPTFALWPCGIEKALVAHLEQGNYAVLPFAKKMGAVFVDFSPIQEGALDSFFNINRPEDLYLARAYEEKM